MTIEKLKSGSYRIKEMRQGVMYSVTVGHKPTKSEARRLLEERTNIPTEHITAERAAASYIDARRSVISPTTASSYVSMVKNTPAGFLGLNLANITPVNFQRTVSDYSVGHSAKSTSNFASFWLSVLRFYGVELLAPKLPQKSSKRVYIPTEAEVFAIMEDNRGTEYEVPLFLACYGLRRSEICALTVDDLDGCVLTINKALVQDESKNWILKETKTTASVRSVVLPQEIADRIRQQGYVYNRHPEYIYRALCRSQKKLGIRHFPLHKLRHFFASYLHNLGYSDKQIQEMGGWASDRTLRQVYQHAMDLDSAKVQVAATFGRFISG